MGNALTGGRASLRSASGGGLRAPARHSAKAKATAKPFQLRRGAPRVSAEEPDPLAIERKSPSSKPTRDRAGNSSTQTLKTPPAGCRSAAGKPPSQLMPTKARIAPRRDSPKPNGGWRHGCSLYPARVPPNGSAQDALPKALNPNRSESGGPPAGVFSPMPERVSIRPGFGTRQGRLRRRRSTPIPPLTEPETTPTQPAIPAWGRKTHTKERRSGGRTHAARSGYVQKVAARRLSPARSRAGLPHSRASADADGLLSTYGRLANIGASAHMTGGGFVVARQSESADPAPGQSSS
jgi:hypothetical protein